MNASKVRRTRRRMGMIFQEYALVERLSGRPFEILRATLCRSELLVEIEGTAILHPIMDSGATCEAEQ